MPIAMGAIGALGVYFGVRALRLNSTAAARVRESLQGVQAERLKLSRVIAAAERARMDGAPLAEPRDTKEVLKSRAERLAQLEGRLRRSLSEREFDRWVPGALQIAASAGVLLSHLPLPMLAAAQPGLVLVTATLWAAFAAAYAVVAGLRAVRLAGQWLQPDGKKLPPSGASVLRQVAARALEAGMWAVFAASAAGATWPLAAASFLGAGSLPVGLCASIGATIWTNFLRSPTHTPTSPTLRQGAPGAGAPVIAQCLRLVAEQQAALADYERGATAGASAGALALRAEMAWDAATKPRCGPTAYAAIARRAALAGHGDALGERALASTVVRILRAEQRCIRLLSQGGKSLDAPQGPCSHAPPQPGEANEQADGAPGPTAILLQSRAVLAWPERLARRGAQQRDAAIEALLPSWTALAAGAADPAVADDAAGEPGAGTWLRLATLQAMGLQGELLRGLDQRGAAQVATLPPLSELAFAQFAATAEADAALAAQSASFAQDFVRLFCAPHRYEEAKRFFASALSADDVPETSPLAQSAPSCSSCAQPGLS